MSLPAGKRCNYRLKAYIPECGASLKDLVRCPDRAIAARLALTPARGSLPRGLETQRGKARACFTLPILFQLFYSYSTCTPSCKPHLKLPQKWRLEYSSRKRADLGETRKHILTIEQLPTQVHHVWVQPMEIDYIMTRKKKTPPRPAFNTPIIPLHVRQSTDVINRRYRTR